MKPFHIRFSTEKEAEEIIALVKTLGYTEKYGSNELSLPYSYVFCGQFKEWWVNQGESGTSSITI